MHIFLQDLRYAARGLIRAPLFSAAAIIMIALGVGANAAIFSAVNGVLLRPLPYVDPDAMVMTFESDADRGKNRNVVSPANYLDWGTQNTAFSQMAAFVDWHANITGDGDPEKVRIQYATASLFPLLGVQPVLGRGFDTREDAPSGPDVVVLGHGLWQRRFGGDPKVLGTTVQLNGRARTIVGVMPEGFGTPASRTDIWSPLGLDPARDYRTGAGRYLTAMARLQPGVTVDAAAAEMAAIASRLATAHPGFNTGWGVNIIPVREHVVGGARQALFVLGGVVTFVLLIACANVANLLLVRSAGREREIALRAALGAGRGRVVRQFMTESLVLAVCGGALGLLVAAWATGAIVALAPEGLPRASEIRIDGQTLVYTIVVTLLTGIAFGVLPAWRASRTDLQAALQHGARGTTGGRQARATLVTVQVALSIVLLVGAGLMLRSFARLQGVDPGFSSEGVLTMRIDLSGPRYAGDTQHVAFFEQLLTGVKSVPGVRSSGAINWLPFSGMGSATDVYVEGRPTPALGEELVADIRGADSDYFRAMQIPIRRGQTFTAADRANTRRVVVINETMAKTVFAGQDPIGQHILMPWGDTLRGEIIGVVGDTRHTGLDSLPRSMIYWAMPQFASNFMSLVVRATGDPMALAPAIRSQVRALDPDVAVADMKPMDEYLDQSVAQRRFTMWMLGIFAGIALTLAMVGLYGALAYSVAQRTREIGVRIALGAGARNVHTMIVREGLVVVAVGAGTGLLAALALTRVMRSLLFDISPFDPLTFAGVSLALLGVSVLASVIPARRASRVDPMDALRSD